MRAMHRHFCKWCLLVLISVMAASGGRPADAQIISRTTERGGLFLVVDGAPFVVGIKPGESSLFIAYGPFGGVDEIFLPGASPTDLAYVPGIGIVISDVTNGFIYVVSLPDFSLAAIIRVPGLTATSYGAMVVSAQFNLIVSAASGLMVQILQAQLGIVPKSSDKAAPVFTTSTIPTPSGAAGPPSAVNLVSGADGNIWFTESLPTDAAGNLIVSGIEKIGRLKPDGTITEFTIPTQYPGVGSTDVTTGTYLVAGSDGNVWFTERIAGKIGRITPAGTITEFKLPSAGTIYGLVSGPDGNIWVKDYTGKIHRITPAGVITTFTIPTTSAGRDVELVTGPDGALWFLEDNAVGRITMAGAITEFPLPAVPMGGTPNYPYQLVFAQDGTGVFTEYTSYHRSLLTLPAASIVTTPAVEYYNHVFDHYFITPVPAEIALLDAHAPPFQDWDRTGFAFKVYVPANAPGGSVATCRFFNATFAPKSSHFYAPHGFGCETTLSLFPDWTLEDGMLFSTLLPDGTGNCPAATVPVYRLYNGGMGGAPNHRFTTSSTVRSQMISASYVPEGNGIGVGFCVPY
jgi:streptogramin lyase